MGVSGVAEEEGPSSSVEGRESVERASGSRLGFGVEGAWGVVAGCGVIVGVRSLSETGSLSRCAVVETEAGVCVGVGVSAAGVGGGM